MTQGDRKGLANGMKMKPNIIFIMSDDHAAKSISCYGGGLNHTPNLDRIAEQGMRFDHCYVTNSICTPSRATILTGQHNHVNGVFTLDSKLDSKLPNVAKHLRSFGGYQTAMYGKWHLGEGKAHEPQGFDDWDVVPGQGQYFDPSFINSKGPHIESGYVTDVITDKTIDFIDKRDHTKPFFVMCHHKAPHRPWEYDHKHKDLYTDEIKIPDTYDDDYKNRARAAAAAKMRVEVDITYTDLALAQPAGGSEVGELFFPGMWFLTDRKIPLPDDVTKMRPLVDKETGEKFIFKTKEELSKWKYQRYMQRYLRTIQSVDDNVGRLLDYLDQSGLSENTMVIYTSDQGFFLGEHGWFDKRFIYEESFQMPFLIKGPGIKPGTVSKDIISNVDFAPMWLDFAGVDKPSYMQGESFLRSLSGEKYQDEDAVAYHRYWMHRDAIHEAYAHYGIRSKRYKIIFWYAQGFGLPGTSVGGEEQEWELFDCDKDPMELFNLWADEAYADIREKMVRLLEKKMIDIGDSPAHPVGLSGKELAAMYVPGADIAVKSGQYNL